MYGFVDTTESAPSTLMSIQTIFNNLNLDKDLTDDNGSFRTLVVNGRGDVEYDINTIGINGMHGTWEEKTPRRKLREISINFQLKTESNLEMNQKLNKLRSMLTGSKKELEFTDEEVIYYATLQSLELPEEDSNDLVGTINFLCSDPDKYGKEKTLETSSDTFIVENKGTANAEPVFELTAKEKTTFAMVATGTDEDSEYNLIGIPVEVDEEVVNQEETVLTERGESLSNWSKTGVKIDDGKADGELGTDGTGILPLSYGSPASNKGWYGPGLMHEVKTMQDFEVEMRLRADTNKPKQMYRIEFYVYDENMNVLGKMAIRDYALYNDRYAAEGRVGEDIKRKDYQISRHNYLRERDHFHGMIRMRRRGQNFELYVARLKTGGNDEGKHHDRFKVDYKDIENKYQGKLKYVQINILRHKEGTSGNVPRINSIKVTELKRVTVDQTPYILNKGDVVTFDHKDEDILINGEPRNDLKNFGGSFFTLVKGYNNLLVYPDGAFDTKVTHRDKYL